MKQILHLKKLQNGLVALRRSPGDLNPCFIGTRREAEKYAIANNARTKKI